jgi:S-formylglutathione hydrolase FrmB
MEPNNAAGAPKTGASGANQTSTSAVAAPDRLLMLPWVDPVRDEPPLTKYHTLRSKTIGGDWSYLLYLPPSYESSPDKRFPVIYWLHGGDGNQRRGETFVQNLDGAIRRGKAPEAIVVLPNGLGRSFWTNSKDGKYPVETALVEDLVAHIDRTCRTIARPQARAIEGMSMGGFGALRIGFRRNDVFGVVSALAPAVVSEKDQPAKLPPSIFNMVMGGDLEYFRTQSAWTAAEYYARQVRNRSTVRIIVGDKDDWTYEHCKLYRDLLNQLDVPHEFVVVPGISHDYQGLYRVLGDKAFDFYAKAFKGVSASSMGGPRPWREPSAEGKNPNPPGERPAAMSGYGKAHPPSDSWGLTALTDLGKGTYRGEQGGLYPGGENKAPVAHEKAGAEIAKKIAPLDRDGRKSPDGKIVLLSLGFSNPTMEFQTFQKLAASEPGLNPHLVIVDGCQGHQAAYAIADPLSDYWTMVDQRLAAAGVTTAQVQAVWAKHAYSGPSDPFPVESKKLERYMLESMQTAQARFPNLKIAYVSSRTYAGYATGGCPEPFAYETGFAVKWLIAGQLAGDPELNYDLAKGPVRSPWLAWGPYFWTDGAKGRKDGLVFLRADLGKDGLHPSDSGREKVATMLLHFLKTDPASRPWFTAK